MRSLSLVASTLTALVLCGLPLGQQPISQGPASGFSVPPPPSPPGGAQASPGQAQGHSLYQSGRPAAKDQSLPPVAGESFVDASTLTALAPPPAPPLIDNWSGISQTPYFPADTDMAIGPGEIVVVVNSTWAVYDKDGGPALASYQFQAWHSSHGFSLSGQQFDPKVAYDHHSNRWILLCLHRDDASQQSHFMVSVSDGATALGTWKVYQFDAAVNGQTATTFWADFPGIGYDNQAIYISANMFSYSPRQFQYSKIRALNKSQMYSFQPTVAFWDHWDLLDEDGSRSFTIQPAETFGSPGIQYFVNSRSDAGTQLTIWAMTSPLSSPTLTRQSVAVASYSAPPDADQQNGILPLDTSDARLCNCVFQNDLLYTVHTIARNWGSGTVAALRAYRIHTVGPFAQRAVDYGADQLHYFYPSIAATASGDMAVVFSRCGVSEFVGSRFAACFAAGTAFGASTQLRHGSGPYLQLDGNNRNRWGDYSGIGRLPTNGTQIWMYSSHTAALNTWGTRIGHTELLGTNESTPPAPWTMVAPQGWTQATPTCVISVQDTGSGLQPASARYQVSVNGGATWSQWQAASATGAEGSAAVETIAVNVTAFTQSSATANRLRFRVDDMTGNSSQSADQVIMIDTSVPAIPSVSIDSGAATTASLNVTVVSSSLDTYSGPLEQRYSSNGSTWSAWQSYTTVPVQYDLSRNGGNASVGWKSVYVQVRDHAGNVSLSGSDSIDYSPTQYTITASAGPGGSISPSGPVQKAVGSSQEFTATPNTSYAVDEWLLDGAPAQAGGTSYVLDNIQANHAVQVTFAMPEYTITASAGAGGGISPSGALQKPAGSSQVFTATPNTNYAVDQWLLDGAPVQPGGGSYTLDDIQANHSVQVTFTIPQYTITASAGAGGGISPSGPVQLSAGGSTVFSAMPNPSYVVDQWLLDGSPAQAGGASYMLGNIQSNHALQVTFGLAQSPPGGVVAWGRNAEGQCDVPALPAGVYYVAISAGNVHSLALRSDGWIEAFGWNNSGECDVPALPAGVVYLTVSAGNGHSAALRSDGQIVCWGYNFYGQCDPPTLPSGISWTKVVAGRQFSVGLRSDGAVEAWGRNQYFQCDVAAMPGGTACVDIGAANEFAVALTADGQIVAWGRNDYQQCDVPQLMPSQTYTGVSIGGDFGMAKLNDGSFVMWGSTSYYGLALVPPQVAGQYVVQVMAGGLNAAVRLSDGSVVAWGDSSLGGDQPEALDADESYVDVSLGGAHTLARYGPRSRYVKMGIGCSGSMPAARLVPMETPSIGEALQVFVDGLPVNVAVLATGWSGEASGAGFLPLSLDFLGMPGCSLRVSTELLSGIIGSAGAGVWQLPLPDELSLVGLELYQQALVFDPSANSFGATMSEAISLVVGNHSPRPPHNIVMEETFSSSSGQDLEGSSAVWQNGARAGLIGGDGRHGSFDLSLGIPRGNNTYEWSTDGFVIPADHSLTGVAYLVSDGKFYFTDLVLPAGHTLRFSGTATPQLWVRGSADIQGTIDISAPDMPSWSPTVGPAAGQRVSDFNGIGPSTSYSVAAPNFANGQPGGVGGAGGGKGGDGAQECQLDGDATAAVGLDVVHLYYGRDGEDVRVPAGHAYAGNTAGTGGKGSLLHPLSGLPVSVPLLGFLYRANFTPGGGGGGFSGSGAPALLTIVPNGVSLSTIQPGGTSFPLLPNPLGAASLNHFLVAGSGGGGGGSHAYGTLNSPTIGYYVAGAGGTGGGGALALRVGGDIVVASTATLAARGGDGVLITGDDPNTPMYDASWGVTSPGGGGSGGSLLLQAGRTLLFDGTMNVRGGQGSRTGSISIVSTGAPAVFNITTSAGSGAPGFYRLESGNGTPTFTGTVATGTPAYVAGTNSGVLTDRDAITGCLSRWRSSGVTSPPTWLRYELDVDLDGDGTVDITYSDSGSPGTLVANDPNGPVRVQFQGARMDPTGTQPVAGTMGPWRDGVGNAAGTGIALDGATGLRFQLIFNADLFPNTVVRSLRVFAQS